jgi:hypothetical protein
MKKVTKQKFPPGWNERKVRAVIAYYDNQTDEEGAAEIEAALETPGATWMSVPTELVPAIAGLIDEHEQKASNTRTRNPRAAEARSKTAPRAARR